MSGTEVGEGRVGAIEDKSWRRSWSRISRSMICAADCDDLWRCDKNRQITNRKILNTLKKDRTLKSIDDNIFTN